MGENPQGYSTVHLICVEGYSQANGLVLDAEDSRFFEA